MTDQDSRPRPALLEISAEPRYTRAGAYVDDPAPSEPARTKIVVGRAEEPAPAAAIEPARSPAETPVVEQPGKQPIARPPYYPLRRRGARIREAGHVAYYDAETPGEGLAAAFDYARSAAARADTAGMRYPPAEDALVDVGRALMAVGDTLTAAMHTWRPEA